jgi:putative zinc finger/helix-turn-helix YgiT family protein
MKRCAICKSKKLTLDEVTETFKVGRHEFEKTLEVLRCKDCDETFTTADAMKEAELGVAAWLADNAKAEPEAIRFMRKSIGLKAKKFAEMMGVADGTVSKWENGKTTIPRSAFMWLCAFVREEKVPTRGGRAISFVSREDVRQSSSKITLPTEPQPTI